MVQAIAAEKVTLELLQDRFGLIQSHAPGFFEEWQQDLPTLTPMELERLTRLQQVFENLLLRSPMEEVVKLTILSPLLDLAGFFLPPFQMGAEESIEITAEETGYEEKLIIRGRLDVLVFKKQFWVMAIEAKRMGFSLLAGLPQLLAYMLANPRSDYPLYGLVTNGSNFLFLKMTQAEVPTYGKSREFVLENPGDLEMVLKILKHAAEIMRG
jgi:hypothetical protein